MAGGLKRGNIAGGPPTPPEMQAVTEGGVADEPSALPEAMQEGNVAGEPPTPPEVLSDGDAPIVASERMRQKLADQGKNLPLVTPNEIRRAVGKLEAGMVAIPGRDFEICKFEITQEIWKPIAGFNPSEKKGDDLPVSNVTLSDIEEFLENLNALPEVRASGKKYRLPTAEEWEYACLAGGTNGFCRLADGTQITEETLGEVAWFGSNSGDAPHSVCKKKPNAFGLYDMHGNVAEWTSTKAPGEMFEYICKGNAYNGKKPQAFRADFSPHVTHGLSFFSLGFRVVR
jgi:formylglycine-generating enzyme required for sulfatase activity